MKNYTIALVDHAGNMTTEDFTDQNAAYHAYTEVRDEVFDPAEHLYLELSCYDDTAYTFRSTLADSETLLEHIDDQHGVYLNMPIFSEEADEDGNYEIIGSRREYV